MAYKFLTEQSNLTLSGMLDTATLQCTGLKASCAIVVVLFTTSKPFGAHALTYWSCLHNIRQVLLVLRQISACLNMFHMITTKIEEKKSRNTVFVLFYMNQFTHIIPNIIQKQCTGMGPEITRLVYSILSNLQLSTFDKRIALLANEPILSGILCFTA